MKKFLPIYFIFIVAISLTLAGCGGGAAAGLIGLAVDDDGGGGISTITISGETDASTLSPSYAKPSIAKTGEKIYLLTSSNGTDYDTSETSVINNGTYSFTFVSNRYSERYLKVSLSDGEHSMFIGKLARGASGTIKVPIKFDASGIIVSKVIEKKNAHKNLICGDNLFTDIETTIQETLVNGGNTDYEVALQKVNSGDIDLSTLYSTSLSKYVLESSLAYCNDAPVVVKWDFGPITLYGDNSSKSEEVYLHQYLSMNKSNTSFSFELYNSDTDKRELSGIYLYDDTDLGFSFYINSNTNFPTDTTIFKSMDSSGESFTITNIDVKSSKLIYANFNGGTTPVSLARYDFNQEK